MKLYVDMDGTLCKWRAITELESASDIYKKGFFRNAEPQFNVLNAIRQLSAAQVFESVEILSAYLTDSDYALTEKNDWLDYWLPEIRVRNFIRCGESKSGFARNGDSINALLDDYSINLHEWDTRGVGIKLLNGINNNYGSWDCALKPCVYAQDREERIVEGILRGINKKLERDYSWHGFFTEEDIEEVVGDIPEKAETKGGVVR